MFDFDNKDAEASFNKILLSKELQTRLLRIKRNQMMRVSKNHRCSPFLQIAPTKKL